MSGRLGRPRVQAARPADDGARPVLLWQVGVGVLLLAGWEAVGHGGSGEWTSRPSLIAVLLKQWR
jgi:hypothetical protein